MNIELSRKVQGLTLVELLVTMLIVIIIAMVGVPSYSSFVNNERLAVATNELYNAYRFARNEALKTSSSMILAADNNNWSLGWQVKNSSGTVLLQSKIPHNSITVSAATTTIKGMGAVDNAIDYQVTGTAGSNCINILSSGQSEKMSCP